MCFVLYGGVTTRIPHVPWVDQHRAFHTRNLLTTEFVIREQFHQQQVFYLGSSHGCGCGFPSWMIHNGSWPGLGFNELEEEALRETEADRGELVSFLNRLLEVNKDVELYGCWSGEEAEPSVATTELEIDEICNPTFMFCERMKYLVRRSVT